MSIRIWRDLFSDALDAKDAHRSSYGRGEISVSEGRNSMSDGSRTTDSSSFVASASSLDPAVPSLGMFCNTPPIVSMISELTQWIANKSMYVQTVAVSKALSACVCLVQLLQFGYLEKPHIHLPPPNAETAYLAHPQYDSAEHMLVS